LFASASGAGALLSGREINTRTQTDLGQTGSIAVAGNASIKTKGDFEQTGATLSVGANLTADIGGSLILGAVQRADTSQGAFQVRGASGSSSSTFVQNITSSVQVGGNAQIKTGQDFTSQGANIALNTNKNTNSQGSSQITSGGNINLLAVKDSYSTTSQSSGSSSGFLSSNSFSATRQSFDESVRGSSLTANGSNALTLSTNNDINVAASQIQTQGALKLNASNVNITTVQEQHTSASTDTGSGGNVFRRNSSNERATNSTSLAIGSQAGGANVNINASQDINIQGSSVIADKDVNLSAGNNINITAGQNTNEQTSFAQKSQSGFLSGGGFGITYGKREQSLEQKSQSTTAAASTVGAITGNININAGQAYKQVGSDLIAPTGDINILAKKVDIIEARETSLTTTEQKFKQTGLTLSVSSPVISAIQSAQAMAQAAGQTSSGRMQALAAASTALNVYNNATDIGQAIADPVGSASINVSIGSRKSQSNSSSQSDTARGSSIAAGYNVNITATGADKSAGQQSDLTIQGSSVKAGNDTTLAADNQINLLAARNESSQSSTNSNSSNSIGASFSAKGISANASVSRGSGKSDGQDTTFTNASISAGNTATIRSGGDTNLIGAVVEANRIKADIGGSLKVESLQNTSTFTSSQKSANASISVPITGGSFGGSVGASKSNVDSSFASVGQQSGLKAGDGGFQVSVANNTALTGGVIASAQSAVDNARNSFTTGGSLSITDLQNTASFKGTAVGASVGVGTQPAGGMGLSGVGVGIGSAGGNASSTTTAGISGIAGNTTVRTGDAETGLQRIFDADKVQREINAQVAITQAFTREAPKAVAKFSDGQIADLKKELANETDKTKQDALKSEIDKWGEGGRYRVLLHTLAGGFSGGASGAAGAAVSASAAPLMNQLQDGIASGLEAAGLGKDAAKGIAQGIAGLTAAGVGTAVGGVQGGASAATVDFNNRQLHPTEVQLIKQNAQRYAKTLYKTDNPTLAQIEAATTMLVNTAQNVLDNNMGVIVPYSKDADNFLQTLKIEYQQQNGTLNLPGTAGEQQLFYATVDQKNQPWLNQGLGDPKLTGLIVRTPINPAVNNPTSDPTRDRLTGLPLDDKGRYQVQVSLDGKNFAPKYFPCANTDCIRGGVNLDTSDPGTQAYIKALDGKIFKDMSTGVNYAMLVTPVGVPGAILAGTGFVASIGSAATDSTPLDEALKYGSQKGAEKFFTDILGHTPGAAIRAVVLIDLAGGWNAFVNRVKVDFLGSPNDKKPE